MNFKNSHKIRPLFFSQRKIGKQTKNNPCVYSKKIQYGMSHRKRQNDWEKEHWDVGNEGSSLSCATSGVNFRKLFTSMCLSFLTCKVRELCSLITKASSSFTSWSLFEFKINIPQIERFNLQSELTNKSETTRAATTADSMSQVAWWWCHDWCG